MISKLIIVFIAFALTITATFLHRNPEAEQWEALFIGPDVSGWTLNCPNPGTSPVWRIHNGQICVSSPGNSPSWITSRQVSSQFRLWFQFKASSGTTTPPELVLFTKPEAKLQHPQGIAFPLWTHEKQLCNRMALDGWNNVDVKTGNDSIQIYLNDNLVHNIELEANQDPNRISFYIPAEGARRMAFRNIRVKSL